MTIVDEEKNMKKIELLLKDLDYRKIEHITVTPHFYEVLVKKYGKKWANEHCSINVPIEKTIYISRKRTYITPKGRQFLKKFKKPVDKR